MIVGITTKGRHETFEIKPFVYESINGTDNIKFKVYFTQSNGVEKDLEKDCVADDVQSILYTLSKFIETTLEEEVMSL